MKQVTGRVRKFGDNIDTDNITPAATLNLPLEELKQHAFEPISAAFYKTVEPGDIIVAGRNFGCGSSREQAADVVKQLGIHYIACESMARIYFRNCIALGLYPILAKGISGFFDEGDEISIDFEGGQIKNLKTLKTVTFKPLSGTTKKLMDGGGILPVLKELVS